MAGSSQYSLRGIGLLASVAYVELKAIEKKCRWRRYGAGEQIMGYLDETTDVYFIVGGSVRATIYSAAGKEVTFRDIGAGDIVGELAAITGSPRTATVVALEESMLGSISSAAFEELVLSHPDVAAQMLKRLAAQVRHMSERVYEFSTLAVRFRIHAELLRMAGLVESHGNTAVIRPFPTHADIASRLSTHREAVSRELGDLVRGGLIERKGDSLIILDLARLIRMVDDARES